jgi:hypothetical protein
MRRRRVGRAILVVGAVLVVVDFTVAFVADRMIRNRPNFFRDVLARQDLTVLQEELDRNVYAGCEGHRALVIYEARTCFRSGTYRPSEHGLIQVGGLVYWRTRPKSLSLLWEREFSEMNRLQKLEFDLDTGTVLREFEK